MRYGFDYITSGSYAGDWSELYFPVDTTVTLTTTRGDSVTTTFTEGTSIVGTYVGINISSGGIIAYRRSDSAPRYLLLPQATAAYSLRGIDGYTGAVVRVRRDSNNDEQDFTAAQLTNGDLAAFCTGDNGFVTTWYDQAGSNDATQATAGSQPKIYDSSTGVVLENGKPAVDFDGVDDYLLITTINQPSEFSHFITSKGTGFLYGTGSGGTDFLRYNSYIRISINGTSLIEATNVDNLQTQTSFIRSNTDLTTIYYNSNTGASSTISGEFNSNSLVSYSIGSLLWNGNIQEHIIYSTDQSANRTAIESNINSYYNIYP